MSESQRPLSVDEGTSRVIQLLRFPLVVGVVYVHAFGGATPMPRPAHGSPLEFPPSALVMILVSQGVARVAVPLFFLIAGFLFFAGSEWSVEVYLLKLRRRVKTLLVPYVLWNFLVWAMYALAAALPARATDTRAASAFTK